MTTEQRYPASQPSAYAHIDLTRRLPSLRASLTPDTPEPEPLSRVLLRREAERTAKLANGMLILWLILCAAIIGWYLRNP